MKRSIELRRFRFICAPRKLIKGGLFLGKNPLGATPSVKSRIETAVAALLVVSAMAAWAEPRMPAVFSDHMVLQAGRSVPVWGMAAPGSTVRVQFAGQSVQAVADGQGYWSLQLKALPSSPEPGRMLVTESAAGSDGADSIAIEDVLVGEVWMAGGQSNMAFPLNSMQGKDAVLAKAANPQLRLFTVTHRTAAEPLSMHPGQTPGDVEGKWVLADATSASAFSAVAYLFGAELQQSLQRPVGMISSNWGGTPIKTWMSPESFQANIQLHAYADEYQKALAIHRKVAADPKNEADYQAAEKLWRKEEGEKLDAAMKIWNEKKKSGADPGPRPTAGRPEPQNPDPTGVPLGGYRPSTPSISWNAMFAPLVPYAVQGALWYQGEANVSGYKEYGKMLRAQVEDWRRQWNEDALEFLCVQLPMNGANGGKRELAHLREQQASVLTLPHTGLAITYDVGDPGDVHPASKIDVAHRLALLARGQVYGQRVAYASPTLQSVSVDGTALRVRFAGVNGKLAIGQAPWVAADAKPLPMDKLLGFEVAGDDGVYHAADARIEGDSVVVSSKEVAAPRFVRYAWDASPQANLYDSTGLPAAPFRTDNDE